MPFWQEADDYAMASVDDARYKNLSNGYASKNEKTIHIMSNNKKSMDQNFQIEMSPSDTRMKLDSRLAPADLKNRKNASKRESYCQS